MKRIALADMPGAPTSGAGCAEYIAPSGQEYACMGVRNGTLIVRITDPANPQIVAHIPGLTSSWHEMAVLGEYLYSVADAVSQGMQIIDLRFVDQNIVTLAGTYTGNGLANIHTIQANPVTKTLYLNGSNLNFVALDATNPTAPVELGRWTTKYVHDCQVVSYTTGPYAGKEIAFLCCAGSGLYIVDVTNKSNMVTLGNLPYLSGSYYTHSGQLTADRKYFLINDEFDERNSLVTNCTTHILNVENLTAPSYAGSFLNPTGAIDHNSHLEGNYMLLSSYKAGMRVYNVANPLAIQETGYFDSYPSGTGFQYEGAWGSRLFPSGNAIISDINRGLFVVDPSEAMGKGAPLLSAAATLGTVIEGTFEQLRKLDRKFIRLFRLVPSPGSMGPLAQMVVDGQSTVTPATFVDLTVGALPFKTGTNATVELYNWNTGSYETIGSFVATKPLPQATFPGLLGSKYVNTLPSAPSGAIRCRITMNSTANPIVGKYAVDLDVVKFTVRRS